jgi:type II secretory pathway pseudopilin PulG
MEIAGQMSKNVPPGSQKQSLGRSPRNRRGRKQEEGYILIAVLFLMVMVLIMLSLAAPKVAADIERDREVELIHRGNQYVRAIKLYYKKFGAYPPNMDALVKTNEIRFLRKRYKDPVTGKDEWHLIHFGENKTPSYGFFGQPISGAGGSALAGVGPGMGQGLGGSSSGSSFGSSPIGGSSIGSSSFGNSPIGGNPVSGTPTDPNAGNATSATGAANGTSGTATGSGTDSSSGTGSSSGSTGSSSSSTFGGANGSTNNGLTVGGLGIIGVESTSPKLAILEWKKKKHFNEWEFWYDPNADRVTISGNTGTIGQPAGSNGNGNSTGTNSPSLFNQPSNSPITTQPQPTQPQPTQPQQQQQ